MKNQENLLYFFDWIGMINILKPGCQDSYITNLCISFYEDYFYLALQLNPKNIQF